MMSTGSKKNLPQSDLSLESLIAQTRAADQAGVFARTEVDFASLTESPRSSWVLAFYERAMVGLPLAACLAIMVGIGAWSFQHGTVNGPAVTLFENGQIEVMAEHCGLDIISRCLSGPGQPTAPGCDCADLDGDGDVDLVDVSSAQRTPSAPR